MHDFDSTSWLNKAISLLAGELSKDEKDAFISFVEQNNEYAEKFRILKKIWHTDLKDVPNHTPNWDKLNRAINQEFALTYYLRKVNLERFDDKSVTLLKNIESELPEEDICCVENVVNALFTDDKPSMLAPKKDLWEKVESSIANELKTKQRKNHSISNRNAQSIAKFRNHGVLITAISSAAAIITLFLILFVFMPSNSSKFAGTPEDPTKENSDDKNPSIEVSPRISPEEVKKSTTIKTPIIDNDVVEPTKKDSDKIEPKEDIPDVVESKDNPKDSNVKDNEIVPDDDVEKPEDNIKKDDTVDNNPTKDDNEKKDSEEGSNKTKTQDFIFNTKYDPIDPEKIKFTLPDSFGRQLSFTYFEEDNSYNTIDVALPTKNGGYKLTTDKNNNLIADWDNDGKPDKILSSTTYKDFRLQYDNGNIKRVQYRVKFVRTDDTWKILPACGLRSKKSYGNYEIMLIDADVNGFYNDINNDFYQYDNQEYQILNSVNYINDNWVRIIPDASGLNIRIKEYLDQKIGTLRVKANYRENVALKWIVLKGDVASITVTAEEISELNLPEGDYKIVKGVVGDGKIEIEFLGSSTTYFPVIAGTTSDLDLGGNLRLLAYNHKIQDGRIVINRNKLYLYGQSGERYHTLRTKHNTEIMNIVSSYSTHSIITEYYKNLNIQGTADSEIVTITLPKMYEPGTYIIKFIEERFCKFLVGKAVTSEPITFKKS